MIGPSSRRHKRISSSAYQALSDALPKVVWKKSEFARLLRLVFRDHPELLAVLVNLDGGTKREVSDEIIDLLVDREDRYQAQTIELMLSVANMSRFPDLEWLNDRDIRVADAEAAVAELRRHTSVFVALVAERERLVTESAEHERTSAIRRQFGDELTSMKQHFMDMHQMTNPQQRGLDFERFLNQLFMLFDLEPRLSYVVPCEQIDGAFRFDTDDYILEARWRKEKVGRDQADAFAAKVGRKGKNALGLMVSVSGFTADVVQTYGRGTPFITMDGPDLFCALEGRARLDDLLSSKKRHANETGECYFPVSRMFE